MLLKKEQDRRETVSDRFQALLSLLGCEESQLEEVFSSNQKEHEMTHQLFTMVQQKMYLNNKQNQKTQIDYEKKRYSKVNSYQIQELARTLKYNLLLHRVPAQEIELYLFNGDILAKKHASIEDMIAQF